MKRIRLIALIVLVAGFWIQGSSGLVRAEETTISRDDEVALQVKTLQEKMLNDADIMALVGALQNDPDMQRLLDDPAAIEAARRGDINALVANPRFMQLLDNPRVREIQRKITQ
ncbi:MAG: hypothetical protein PHD01_06600 [Geobacteraceae bacterium]|nr:hypothetical protein [Geobacteraceae bacterium]